MIEISTEGFTIALAGNPNCGKTALFNALTGGHAKVGNYPGVTVERKEGRVVLSGGRQIKLLDLPGTYSLDARTPDEKITREVLLGQHHSERRPQAIIGVVDATNLDRGLGLILELRELGIPLVIVLNMMDLAEKRGQSIDLKILERELGVPLISTVATEKKGLSALLMELNRLQITRDVGIKVELLKPDPAEIRKRFAEVDRILSLSMIRVASPAIWSERIDRIVLHPIYGTLVLAVVLAFVFQAIFSWAEIPMEMIKNAIALLGNFLTSSLGKGPLESLLVDGVLAGVGAVLVFLPQILILFTFILVLEDSGYMARAAFLMDRLMGKVGLHGRAFIPLLSSFACAVPGIMATRTIEQKRDRITTILVAPLMTCSARLPVYSLIIAAFIPNTSVVGPLRLQGLVMFGLYLSGILAALVMAVIFKFTLFRGPNPTLLMELPTYKLPYFKNIMIGLWDRSLLFLQKAGTVILTVSILLWFLVSYPKAPVGATAPAISYSYAGVVGHALEPLVRPIGFNWKIAVALIPGFAAREVMIGSLATVYAVEGKGSGVKLLGTKLAEDWSLATALSLLVWYVLACQCISTLAVTRRETNSWRWPALMFFYMTGLAYLGSYCVFNLAIKLGFGLPK